MGEMPRGEPAIATRLRDLRGTRTIEDVVYEMRAHFGPDETLSRSTLINYEKAKTAQRIDVLRKFAEFYGRTLTWIIEGEEGEAITRATGTATGGASDPAPEDHPQRRATDRKRP